MGQRHELNRPFNPITPDPYPPRSLAPGGVLTRTHTHPVCDSNPAFLLQERPSCLQNLASQAIDTERAASYVQRLNGSRVLGTTCHMPVPDSSILRVLRLLDSSPRLTQREMARELGVSLGKANYCLRALLGRGFVKVQNFRRSTNKRGYVYLLTPEGATAKAELTRAFLARKLEEYEALRLEIQRLEQESREASEPR